MEFQSNCKHGQQTNIIYDSLSTPQLVTAILIGKGSPTQQPSGESQVPHNDSKRKNKNV
jgi:hypothetical protein